MKISTHHISRDMFLTLARGGGGISAVHCLRNARHSKNLALVRYLIHAATKTAHPEAPLARAAYRALSAVQRHSPQVVKAMLDYPSVGSWIVETTLSLMHGESTQARPGQLAAVAASAAIRGGAAISIELPAVGPTQRTIALPSLGTICVPGSTHDPVQLTCRADGAALTAGADTVPIPLDPHQDSWCWSGIRKISAEHQNLRMEVLLDPTYRYPLPEHITPYSDEMIRRHADTWAARLAEGWKLLVSRHPEVAAEFTATTTVLVPLAPAPSGQISATFHDAFGCIAMSLPADARATAVTIAHEIQHNKLAAMMDLFPLVTNSSDSLFYAPWRNDPRPLIGLLHGLYAYIGVTAFWRRQRNYEDQPEEEFQAQVEFARWREGAHDVAGVLLGTRHLTPMGEFFVSVAKDMLDGWCQDRVPTEAITRAESIAAQHRRLWDLTNGLVAD